MHVEEAKVMHVEEAKEMVVEEANLMACFPFFKAQILILLSGRDQWLPCHKEDTERLLCALPKCEVREFVNNGQFIFLVRYSHLLHV
ncbi:hypothetical protein Bca52824_024360 [Brassica carinata]|uniref:Uncharacterized protein n=1 Tax=Brassica carinata TaxID=52824 RepID=A0A8X8AVP3_BRACI|nr:hypothetical protein Bca52824_024360 [Brassica carinata]